MYLLRLNASPVLLWCLELVCRMLCQRSWLYLEPIFSSEDINRQLPVESKRYQTMDRMWRKIMSGAKKDPKVCPDSKIKITAHTYVCAHLLFNFCEWGPPRIENIYYMHVHISVYVCVMYVCLYVCRWFRSVLMQDYWRTLRNAINCLTRCVCVYMTVIQQIFGCETIRIFVHKTVRISQTMQYWMLGNT